MLHPKIRPMTDAERKEWPRDVIVPLEKPHVDDRGMIQPLVDTHMESCVLITSKKGRYGPTTSTIPTGTIATSSRARSSISSDPMTSTKNRKST